ncbi:MAG: type 1 glutamine amidotransferase [Candidatus Methanoperedens sp.]|nr:type 1 glutamine amidotransferase [Candidatus Methanoperedens sp.]
MKALILVAGDVEDIEFFYRYYRQREEGWEIDVAAPDARKIVGKHGYDFEPDRKISEASAEDHDLLVLPGGKAPEQVRLQPEAVEIARSMLEAGKTVAAVCHGIQTLISADVLRGRKATCWPGIRDDAEAAGAEYLDQEVVIDGNLITSRRPEDLPAFCRETLAAAKQAV